MREVFVLEHRIRSRLRTNCLMSSFFPVCLLSKFLCNNVKLLKQIILNVLLSHPPYPSIYLFSHDLPVFWPITFDPSLSICLKKIYRKKTKNNFHLKAFCVSKSTVPLTTSSFNVLFSRKASVFEAWTCLKMNNTKLISSSLPKWKLRLDISIFVYFVLSKIQIFIGFICIIKSYKFDSENGFFPICKAFLTFRTTVKKGT